MTVKEQSQVVTSLAKDNFIPGHFRIAEGETGPAPFAATFSGDYEQTSTGSDEATGTIDSGDELTCTITKGVVFYLNSY